MAEHLPKDQAFIRNITEIIHANLRNENFGVEELARLSGISRYSLNRRLKSYANKTINQFISEIRLTRALELLRDEELTASEVAYQVGFSSPAYFTKCFHDFFGYPPGKVKKDEYSNHSEREPSDIRPVIDLKKPAQFKFLRITGGFLLLIIAGYFAYGAFKKSVRTDIEKSIAVLPFRNLSDSAANQYFIDGLMDEILSDLSRIHDLRVVSRTSVEQYRESARSSPEIARRLNVGYIVEGSGQKYGNHYSLRVQLIEALKDRHLWAGSYAKEIHSAEDIFDLQSQIAQEIAAELDAKITPEEKHLIEKIPTSILTAYDFYRRGEEELRKYQDRGGTIMDLNRAEKMYYQALQYDSTFARAYFGLAQVYASRHFHETYFSENFLDSILILADKALKYDDHLAEAYYARAYYYIQNGKKQQAVSEYDKALEYNPNYWEAYWNKGLNVYIMDDNNIDFVRGLEYLHKAISINRGPDLPVYLRFLGDVYGTFAGFHEKAKYYYQEAFRLDGDTSSYLYCLAAGENASGNHDKAVGMFRTCFERDTDNVEYQSGLALTYYILGDYRESLRYIRKFEKKLDAYPWLFYSSMNWIGFVCMKNGYRKEAERWFLEQKKMSEESIRLGRFYSIDANLDLASLYAFMGDKEKAQENLLVVDKVKAYPLWLVTEIKTDSLFNNIRNEPYFRKISDNIESKYKSEHERVRIWLLQSGQDSV